MSDKKNTNIIGKEKANVNVLMLGKSGVGKTTVLSLLYYDLNKKEPFGFKYECSEPKSKKDLEHFLRSLRSPITGEVDDRISSDGILRNEDIKLDGTNSERTYECAISKKDGKKLGSITLCDIVGGNLEKLDVTDTDALDKFKKLFEGADIFILPLNAPSIMEGSGSIPEEFNSFRRLETLLAQIDNKLYKDKPFIFVPIRCEKYKNEFDKVIEKVESHIAGFSDRIKGCYSIFPVITLGGLETSIKIESDKAVLAEVVKKPKVKHEHSEKLAALISLYWAKKYCDTQFKHKNENIEITEKYRMQDFIKKSKQKKLKEFKNEIQRYLQDEYGTLSPFVSDIATGDSHAPSFMYSAKKTYDNLNSNK